MKPSERRHRLTEPVKLQTAERRLEREIERLSRDNEKLQQDLIERDRNLAEAEKQIAEAEKQMAEGEKQIADLVNVQVLRRTCATLFGAKAKDPRDTPAQLRHADPTVTLRHYQKLIPANVKAAALAWRKN